MLSGGDYVNIELKMAALRLTVVVAFLVSYGIAEYPFREVSLDWATRVNDLVSRLSLEEITLQMAKGGSGSGGGPAPAIPRLGINPFQWNTECLRGVVLHGTATAFPQAINLGAMFDWRILNKVADAIGVEARAKNNNNTAHGNYGDYSGINCWAPMLNMMRHPLWGRNQEVYGEDPYLTGRYAEAYVQGLQGSDERYLQAAANCKAYMAYAGPEENRLKFDAMVSERDLRLTFLPAFKRCVGAGTSSYMCSYNSVNGVPMCANKRILNDILRKEWGFKGFVVSDMRALEAVVNQHGYLNTTEDTVAAALAASCNLELSSNDKDAYYTHIADVVKKGMVSESYVREMVKPLFLTRMRLGDFDPPSMNPYRQYGLALVQSPTHADVVKKGMVSESYVREMVKPLFLTRMRLGDFDPPSMNLYRQYGLTLVQSPAHRTLATRAAMKSFVLLKNSGLLPLNKKFKKIAMVGPMTDNLADLYGDYEATVDPRYGKTPLQGLRRLAEEVGYGPGCMDNRCTNYTSSNVTKALNGAQLIIVSLGTGLKIETEGIDRHSMSLPGNQSAILQDAIKYGEGAPIILLLFSAGPLNVTLEDADPRVHAIMQCGFSAEGTGEALYNTLTMATPDASPAGRLPYTWYLTADQIPSITSYTMTERTYRYFTGTPAYPFGYGLSYTTFQYTNLLYDPEVRKGQQWVMVKVDVTNTGTIASDEVAQVYISWATTKEVMPKIQLVSFDRMFIVPKQTVTFDFKVKVEDLAVWSDMSGFVIEEGLILLYVGGQLPGQVRQLPSNVLQGKIYVTETYKLPN